VSTAARKARKKSVNGIELFVHPAKVGTPPTERLANQPRSIVGRPNKVTRFGLTKKAERDLKARGIDTTGGDAA
jgi:hypothetical protein